MSNREKALQRLEAAMASLETAADRRLSANVDNAPVPAELAALTEERDRLAAQVEEQSKRNADLGARLDKAIAKLNKVLERA